MRELLVVSNYWPTAANPISGIFVVQQVAALSRAGYKVVVLIGQLIGRRNHFLTPGELRLQDSVRLVTIPFLRLPENLSGSIFSLMLNNRMVGMATASAVRRQVARGSKPDAVIVHGLRYFGTSARFWIRLIDVPRVIFIHGVDPVLTRPRPLAWIRSIAKSLNETIDCFALVGSPLRRNTEPMGLAAAKTVVVPNGTDLPTLNGIGSTPSDAQQPLSIVSVSNLIPLKGIDDNLAALRLVINEIGDVPWTYRIVGDGPDRAHLQALANSLGLADRVSFLGRLPYEQTMAVVAKADIFSLPSWGEAFGIVYLEAMSRMKPTVGCLENGAADIITDGRDGILVPPREPKALASVLSRLIQNRELREKLGREARITAERYTWDANVQCTLGMLGLYEPLG